MAKGAKTGGRVAGTPNKMTTAAKDAIAQAAENLGGTSRLVEWAKEDPKNEATFWGSIYPKLIPLDVNHGGKIDMTLKASRDAAVAAATRSNT